jgi:hypothetical protein
MPKYLFLQRSLPAQKREQPSPAQMHDMFAAFNTIIALDCAFLAHTRRMRRSEKPL